MAKVWSSNNQPRKYQDANGQMFGHQTMNLNNIRSSCPQTILAATSALVYMIVMSMTRHLCHSTAWAPETCATIAKAAPCDLKCVSHTHARRSPNVNEVYSK